MLNSKGERALAYIVTLDEKKPIEGYSRVEYGRSNGWWCIISKEDNIQVGDKCVYFEVDSKVPSTDERFAFLEKRHYKIKTQKMCKVLSQGLLMPITLFPEFKDLEVGSDVTDLLGVKYSVEEDNARKNTNPNAKYDAMMQRRKKLFKKPWAKWFMRRSWGRKLMFLFFGKKKDNPRGFPSFISKTDEERVENMPWILDDNETRWLVTEKLDGTSCTYALERKKKDKYEFYVCSRNVRQADQNQTCYHDHNIYWDLAFSNHIESVLKTLLIRDPELSWVAIQGEGVGNVQGNPLKLSADDLYVFNLIDSKYGRYPSEQGKKVLEEFNIKWVPILGEETLPSTMEEMKELADGKSMVNPEVSREGLVYRSLDGKQSFKNVSNKYLLKSKE